jgi:TFIIF-interacting CTD phosphatase-like protein
VGTCDAAPPAKRVLHQHAAHEDNSGQGPSRGLDAIDLISIQDDVKNALKAGAPLIRELRKRRVKLPGKSDTVFKSKKILVLNIDGTLLYSADEGAIPTAPHTKSFGGPDKDAADYILPRPLRDRLFVWLWPKLGDFLEKCSSLYDVVVISAADPEHVGSMCSCIDPTSKYIQHWYTRDHMSTLCVKGVKFPNSLPNLYPIKDLSSLFKARGEENVVLIDDKVAEAALHLENLIPIAEFRGNKKDHELSKLLPFLEDLAKVPDVRVPICQRYGELWKHLVHEGDCTHKLSLGA